MTALKQGVWRQLARQNVTVGGLLTSEVDPGWHVHQGHQSRRAQIGSRGLGVINWTNECAECLKTLSEVRICSLQSVSLRQPPADRIAALSKARRDLFIGVAEPTHSQCAQQAPVPGVESASLVPAETAIGKTEMPFGSANHIGHWW